MAISVWKPPNHDLNLLLWQLKCHFDSKMYNCMMSIVFFKTLNYNILFCLFIDPYQLFGPISSRLSNTGKYVYFFVIFPFCKFCKTHAELLSQKAVPHTFL